MFASLSLKQKTTLVIAALLLLAIVPLIATREVMIRSFLMRRMETSARTTGTLLARVLAEPLAQHNLPSIRKITLGLGLNPDLAYVALYDRRDEPVFILNNTGAHLAEEPDRPGVQGVGELADGIYDVAEPVVYRAQVVGKLRLGFSTASLMRDARMARNSGIRMGLVAFLIGLFVTYFLLQSVFLQPLSQVVAATRAMSHGHLSHEVRVASGDEFGELATAFNEMARSIRAGRENLEQRVAQRTKELSIANERLRDSELKLQMANQDLASANRLKSEFLANMSHELRTPLNAIIGFSELLQDQVFGPLNERQAKYVGNILTSGRHLLQLINDILDLSKIEAGRMDLNLETFALREALSEVETIVNPLAARKRIALKLDLDASLPPVVADRSKVKQIMYNLLSNAIKFTGEGGSVTVSDRLADGWIEVSVRDTGIGIRPEDTERVFQEFRQADGSAARQYEGTGLGLALTRRFVRMHGGEVWLQSEVGKGSTFFFTLPYTDPIAPPEAQAQATAGGRPEASTSSRPLVLIAEDDAQARELLGLALTQAGYRVAMAADGDEAIRLANELLPFAITLDIMLPKRDGWQVLRDLKGDPKTEAIPVVVVSILDNRDLGFSLGAADYFVKPVDRPELLRKLGRFSFTTKVKTQTVRVLAIDDDPQALELIATALSAEGFEVLRAYGGQEGIDLAQSQLPDAIILDLMMPQVSGFEVIQRLAQDPLTAPIPIFVLTAMELTDAVRDELNGCVAAVSRKGTQGTQELLAELGKLERLSAGTRSARQ